VELAARHLHRQGVRKLVIANRSLARAADLAARFNGVATSLAELDERLPEADLVITATRATEPVISYAQVQEALRLRRRRPMCIVDVGVPRDVDARVATLEDAYLYTVDDLETVIEEGWRSRRQAAAQAEQIIDFAVEQYERLLRTLDAVPTIRALRGDTERLRDEALSQARRQLQAGRDAEEVLEQLAHALTQKFLHAPSIRLRAAAEDTDTDLIAAATELFGLAERPERDG
jgi:glutamyl-tRNA reductase